MRHMDNMETQQMTTDLETEASSEETLSDKPDILRARGRPNRSPRRESPGPEVAVETTGVAAENNGNDDDASGPLRTSGGSLSIAFLTANAANAAAHAACAASIAAHAANGAAAAAAYAADIAYSAASVASHASVSASAAARAASIAASRAAANESLRVTNRPPRRGTPRQAPSSGSAAPHAG